VIASNMVTPDVDPKLRDVDVQRRDELRSFLLCTRSRLDPRDVGLPATSRRRVPGLRRGEVAELIGVTVDWYRWFECGRPVRVSPQFVSRLTVALRLNEREELTLFRLAIPEMYLATRRFMETGAALVA
jgi:Helix-turn-helix domain